VKGASLTQGTAEYTDGIKTDVNLIVVYENLADQMIYHCLTFDSLLRRVDAEPLNQF
jgi:hypothetical protein